MDEGNADTKYTPGSYCSERPLQKVIRERAAHAEIRSRARCRLVSKRDHAAGHRVTYGMREIYTYTHASHVLFNKYATATI
jgi:hypothetical protein